MFLFPSADQVVNIQDRKRLELALPHMAAGPVVPVMEAGVGRQLALHPAPEATVSLRAHDQMEAIGHQTIALDIDGLSVTVSEGTTFSAMWGPSWNLWVSMKRSTFESPLIFSRESA